MIATRISVTCLSAPVLAIKAGPVTLRVATRERLISVTVALFENSQLLAKSTKLRRKSAVCVWNDQKHIRFLSNALVPLSELGLTTDMSSFQWMEDTNHIRKSISHIPVVFYFP